MWDPNCSQLLEHTGIPESGLPWLGVVGSRQGLGSCTACRSPTLQRAHGKHQVSQRAKGPALQLQLALIPQPSTETEM